VNVPSINANARPPRPERGALFRGHASGRRYLVEAWRDTEAIERLQQHGIPVEWVEKA